MLFDATLQQGLEGIVSKRLGSPLPARTSAATTGCKFAHRHRGSFVVGGWRPEIGTSDRLARCSSASRPPTVGCSTAGASAVASPEPASTRPGRALLAPLSSSASPFADEVPRVDAVGTFWVEPRVVVDIDTSWPRHERLRQPAFQGVRDDVSPEDLGALTCRK